MEFPSIPELAYQSSALGTTEYAGFPSQEITRTIPCRRPSLPSLLFAHHNTIFTLPPSRPSTRLTAISLCLSETGAFQNTFTKLPRALILPSLWIQGHDPEALDELKSDTCQVVLRIAKKSPPAALNIRNWPVRHQKSVPFTNRSC
jgi:hypothetical protein